ncbi:nucleotidyltransferase domain-containing protein [Psychrobacter sanguinis]|uniref:nucleotidyltransferase domain-containing protein n=1 Tax=Psychrobacter sanguinis TaxID=861445 RepID=UPI002A755D21|nr:nucleotidyltransferase domain-containing protein [Psychrobacter sanguinis]MDY3306401.1 nucleotidyltransferase domain-containing protein [Psychrobacter sanguinis]
MSEYQDYLKNNNFLEILKSFEFSNTNIEKLREDITAVLDREFKDDRDLKKLCIVTTGSFARREASEASDLDYFIIIPDHLDKEYVLNKVGKLISEAIQKTVKKDAGSTGTFGIDSIMQEKDLLLLNHNNEHNKDLTRRMLLILEGDYLYNEKLFLAIRKKILDIYIGNNEVKFIINDIARYYRTMLTDFHYKINFDNKDWGVRSIKLKFSRKIIYLSGLLSITIFESTNSKEKNIDDLEKILSFSPLERTFKLLKSEDAILLKIFEEYNYFLEIISNDQKRTALDEINRGSREESELYLEINRKGESFKDNCYKALSCKYSGDKGNFRFEYLVI